MNFGKIETQTVFRLKLSCLLVKHESYVVANCVCERSMLLLEYENNQKYFKTTWITSEEGANQREPCPVAWQPASQWALLFGLLGAAFLCSAAASGGERLKLQR